jgi:hypothetical protein
MCGKRVINESEMDIRAQLELVDWEKVAEKTGIKTWTFSPPFNPELNGSAEAMVKLAKRRINSDLKSKLFHSSGLQTAAALATETINSRPLTYVTSTLEDSFVLTVNKYLKTGLKPAGNVAEDPNWEDPKNPYIKHWDQICQTINMMWQRWRRDILPTFHTFPKWTKWSRNPKKGDMVMVFDKSAKRNDWPMGIITELIPDSQDNVVRKVKVRCQFTKNQQPKTFIRAIVDWSNQTESNKDPDEIMHKDWQNDTILAPKYNEYPEEEKDSITEPHSVSNEVKRLGGPIFDTNITPRARNVVKYTK